MKGRNAMGAAAAAMCLGMCGAALAGRPMAIDDADAVDVRQFEFECGAGCVHDPTCDHWDFPVGLACGVLPGLEVGVAAGGQFEERAEVLDGDSEECSVTEEGFGDLVVGAKWMAMGERGWVPRQALAPSVKFPTADESDGLGSGETDYDLTWIASKLLSEDVGCHVNVGYSWIGEPEGEDAGDVLHYGVAVDVQLAEPLQWVGEVFGERELTAGADTILQYNAGLRWNPRADVTFDIAAGAGFGGDAPDFSATAGVTWAFGAEASKDNKQED